MPPQPVPTPAGSRRRTALVANPSADLYGSDRMMLETVRGLVADGWRVVVAASVPGPLTASLEEAGAEFVVCPAPVIRRAHMSPKGLVTLAREAAAGWGPMARLVRQVRPDVIYVSTVTIPEWFAVARRFGIPSVSHIHEAEGSTHPVIRHGLALPTAAATTIIYNSRTSREVGRRPFLDRAGATRVIHNGVAGPDTIEPPREQIDGPVRLVYIGRLSPRKGVDLAVRAVAALRDAGQPATLALVGAVFPGYEWYEAELRALVAELDLADAVDFVGFASPIWPHLAASDISLVPSRGDESFGNVVVEAVLAARPVVVADHTGLSEAREGLPSAVPVPTEDAQAIADAVLGLIATWPSTRTQALADAALAAERYAPRRYQSRVGSVLTALADGEPVPEGSRL